MKIDVHQHLGIRDVKAKEIRELFDYIVLNPAYKYGCMCCVDGFYQQYLWNKGKDYLQLGIYNPKCRVPAEVELGRQYDKGIVGIVLNPINHDFELKEAWKVYQFAEDHNLPVFVCTGRGKGNPLELKNIVKEYKIRIVLMRLGYPQYINQAKEVIKESNIYGEISSVPIDLVKDFPKDKLIFGSCYPYIPLSIIKDKEILDNARKIINI